MPIRIVADEPKAGRKGMGAGPRRARTAQKPSPNPMSPGYKNESPQSWIKKKKKESTWIKKKEKPTWIKKKEKPTTWIKKKEKEITNKRNWITKKKKNWITKKSREDVQDRARTKYNIGGRANLLEEMGRIDARKHSDAADRAEKRRVIRELNKGYKSGGAVLKGKKVGIQIK